jgi:hypothetical protein
MQPGSRRTNPGQGTAAGRSVAGIRLSALLEIALFIGVALIVDRMFFDGTRFRSASQHPFWIPVLLVSVQYGINAGLVAAAAASVALLAGNVPPQSISQDRFAFVFEVCRLPLMWFISAVVLGELRMRQIRERSALRRELVDTNEREQTVTAAYKRLGVTKDALETRLAGQLRSTVGMYESVRAMEKLNPSEVLMGMGDLIRSVMNPEKFSAYLLKNGRLEMAAREGWSEQDEPQRDYGPESDLFMEIVARQRVLSVANPVDATVLAGDGVAAAPIVVADTGHVIGMLKIEKLGFLDLTFSNLQMLKVLCQWIGAAYNNALRYQAAREESVVNTETELFAYGYFSRQLSFLSDLAVRADFDLAMIVVRLNNADQLPPEKRAAVPRAFGRAAARALRKTDLAFDYQRTGTEFVIILPASPAGQTQVVVGKLRASLAAEQQNEAPDAQFTFTVHVIHETKTAMQQDLLELAKATEKSAEMQRV